MDFRFDGWGGKFPASRDNALSRALQQQSAFRERPLKSIALTLEGGAIDSNGQGLLLATRSSVLCPKRNPDLSAQAIEQRLKQELGLQHILWLEHGHLAGDDTDGHIDTLARFISSDSIVYQAAGDQRDVNRQQLVAMQHELESLQMPNGERFNLSALPWPGCHLDDEGNPLPASYANFLIINNAVLMPCYGVAQDSQAKAVLQQAFPARDIIGVDCQALIRQYGSLHCVTMNIPA